MEDNELTYKLVNAQVQMALELGQLRERETHLIKELQEKDETIQKRDEVIRKMQEEMAQMRSYMSLVKGNAKYDLKFESGSQPQFINN